MGDDRPAARGLVAHLVTRLRAMAENSTDALGNRHIRGISGTLTRGSRIMTGHDLDLAARIAAVSRDRDNRDLLIDRRLDPGTHQDMYGRPLRRRTFTKAEYITMWERRIGRRMTADELRTLDRGCVGMTMLRLGRTSGNPPLNLMFGHPRTPRHDTAIALGEAANAEVRRCRALRVAAYEDLAEARRRPDTTDASPAVRERIDRALETEYDLQQARTAARNAWMDIPADRVAQARAARAEARVHDGHQALAIARNYAAKFDDLLATRPPDTTGFLRRVQEDPDLSKLTGVADDLPTTGAPADWEPVIFAKHLWSGQDHVRDSNGREILDNGRPRGEATDTPKHGRFTPRQATGQVNMWGDFNQNRLGFLNFDYAWYDAPTDTWWRANHSETGDPRRPMLVHQSTSEEFLTGSADFDTTVVGIGFADTSR
ncbi:hypothetical protein [Nocardia carnea]|uniref:hypothetical protein n=1 Tax=Nocardia carnea TaxID=37328 RepID=UPI002458DA8F|nr:hypothetical protein [Nocardia carnea]